jgi:hypothetical protein
MSFLSLSLIIKKTNKEKENEKMCCCFVVGTENFLNLLVLFAKSCGLSPTAFLNDKDESGWDCG